VTDKVIASFLGPDGAPIRVEVDALTPPGGKAPAAGGEAPAVAPERFETVLAGLKPICRTVFDQIADLAPAEATVELGVKIAASGGVVLASAASEGHVKVTLTWKGTGGG